MKKYIFLLTFVPRFVRQMLYKWFNRLVFKSAGVKIGKHFMAYNHVSLKFYKGATCTIGDNFTLLSGDAINPLCRNINASIFIDNYANLLVGSNVGMSSPCIWCSNSIAIGNNVNIGALTTLLDTDCHSLNFQIRRRGGNHDKVATKTMPIVIEDDVMIGCDCIILKGVRIGARSIIGAGSVVTKDIPADCIAAGNPCKVIRCINNNVNENE